MLIQDGYDKNRLAGARYDINGRSPTATAEYFKYDASGNVWYDRHAKTAYKLNAAGLPEVAYIQNEYDADLTLSSVNSGSVDDLSATMYMTYDETGSRVWTRVQTPDMDYGEATLPGVGVYSADLQAQTGYALKRMDLVAGGYRDVSTGKAYFPVTDAQGNVRGYADDEGLVSAYDYYAYGGVKALTVNSTTDDNKRWVFIRETLMQLKWQSFIEKDILRRSGCEAAFLLRSNRDSAQGKEYDKPIQKHYFGARYFDPFFGLSMSPDPAGQFANPYSYGGDPMNYVDLYGLWSIGLGITIGWENGNFTAGAGVALDIGSKEFGVNLNLGYSYNFGDGSDTFSAVAGASGSIGYFGVGGKLGYSYNNMRGSTLSYGIRGSIVGVGVGANGANYWNTSGDYLGGTAALEAFAGYGPIECYTGYEWGYDGMTGRGEYSGVRAFGFHSEYAQNGGYSFGGQILVNLATYDADNHPSGYTKNFLKRVYDEQVACGNTCEIAFTKDGFYEVLIKKNKNEPFSTRLFDTNDDDAHSHYAEFSENPDRPSTQDGYSVQQGERILRQHYALLPERQEIVRYMGPERIQNENDYTFGNLEKPIVLERWSIYDNVGWKWDFKVKKFGY